MKIFFSISQTKSCTIRSNKTCDNDDDLVVMSNLTDEFYVFIKQMTFIAIIQLKRHNSFRLRFEKFQILILKLISK